MTPAADFMVSCLMVTLAVPERLDFLRRSVVDIVRQTHCSKELVIVFDFGPPETKTAIVEHVASLRRNDIRIVDPRRKLSLGALRNIAREAPGARFYCQWDDDDLHHPERLERQLDYMIQAAVRPFVARDDAILSSGADELYCTNWRASPPKKQSLHVDVPAIGADLLPRNWCRFARSAKTSPWCGSSWSRDLSFSSPTRRTCMFM